MHNTTEIAEEPDSVILDDLQTLTISEHSGKVPPFLQQYSSLDKLLLDWLRILYTNIFLFPQSFNIYKWSSCTAHLMQRTEKMTDVSEFLLRTH